jgi:thiol-disulfide isomerase/thioredoxin
MKIKFLITTLLLDYIYCKLILNAQSAEVKPKVTFVELGSVNCIPCKQMQPVMKAIEKKYGEQVKVIFYNSS